MKRRPSFGVPPTRRERARLAPEPPSHGGGDDYFGRVLRIRTFHDAWCPRQNGMAFCSCRGGAPPVKVKVIT